MKLSSQEEYGLRCLLRVGREADGGSLTIAELSRAEGISPAAVAASFAGFISVTVVRPLASVGALAPVTFTPAAGFALPFSS